ncbi:MAG: N-acetyltransferase [Phycisphaerales bacterium]|nr:N-acetyltransferase [Phycisphaerales bacterium]
MPVIRLLTPDDAPAYAALRREMLVESSWAFLRCIDDDFAVVESAIAAKLAENENDIAGAFDDRPAPCLLASAGVVRLEPRKTRHRALIWGVYVSPAARGRGLGRAVMNLAINTARTWPGVECIWLSVSERTPAARALYESLGFVTWGTEPDAIRIGSESAAEHHMHLRL